jgi:hypothetical protein
MAVACGVKREAGEAFGPFRRCPRNGKRVTLGRYATAFRTREGEPARVICSRVRRPASTWVLIRGGRMTAGLRVRASPSCQSTRDRFDCRRGGFHDDQHIARNARRSRAEG